MSTLTQFFGGRIKSIQRGQIQIGANALSATATISAVNTAKTIVNFCGSKSGYYLSGANMWAQTASIALTSINQLTATQRISQALSTQNASVSFEVIEYF
jgi:hypothetical protein